MQTFSFYLGLPSQNCRNKINKVFIELKNGVRALQNWKDKLLSGEKSFAEGSSSNHPRVHNELF